MKRIIGLMLIMCLFAFVGAANAATELTDTQMATYFGGCAPNMETCYSWAFGQCTTWFWGECTFEDGDWWILRCYCPNDWYGPTFYGCQSDDFISTTDEAYFRQWYLTSQEREDADGAGLSLMHFQW